MDVQMPEMDGLEATATIRERERSSGQHIPIIAMTAHALKGDKERCLSAGMDAYTSKPIHPNELFATIEKALGKSDEAGAAEMPEAQRNSRARTKLSFSHIPRRSFGRPESLFRPAAVANSFPIHRRACLRLSPSD